MSKRIRWQLPNFKSGLHTSPSDVERGDVYALDMKNLRAGARGSLEVRYPVRTAKDVSGTITGLSVSRRGSDNILLYQKTGGVLGFLSNAITPTDLVTDANLSGRLSSDFLVKNVVVLTSEGEDRGYWIDLHDYLPNAAAYPFGVTPPDWSAAVATPTTGAGNIASPGYYYYRLVFERNSLDIGEDEPFYDSTRTNDMRSNPATRIIEVFLAAGEDTVEFTQLPVSTEPHVTRKALYRSAVQPTPVPASSLLDLTYWRVNSTLNANGNYTDVDTEAAIMLNPTLSLANDRMAVESQNVAVYNDRVWAASNAQLQYSDIRDGNPIWWAFPESNAITEDIECVFCVNYRETLLFGGPNGIWRLTGTSEFNFDLDQISTVGPLDGFAWAETKDLIAFVGVNGLYVCDGVRVLAIHDSALKTYFKDVQIKKGSCVYFPSEEILFNTYVDLSAGGSESRQFLRTNQGGWEKWEGINILQGDWLVTTSAVDGEKTLDIYVAEDSFDEIREILWDRTGFSQDSDLTGTSDIEWSWQSQRIDWENQGLEKYRKTFRWLEILVAANVTITVEFWIDGVSVESSSYSVARNGIRPYRVPIRRRGFDIQFELSGSGSVEIESLTLVGSVNAR